MIAQTDIRFLCSIPKKLIVNEEARSDFSLSLKIETLIKELEVRGPMNGLAQIGPDSYVEKPVVLKGKYKGQPVLGWKGATRKKVAKQANFILIGAQRTIIAVSETSKILELVYFILSIDITPNTRSSIRTHIPSLTDRNIYAISFKSFHDYIYDLYPPVVSDDKDHKVKPSLALAKPHLILSQLKAKLLEDFIRLPLASIIDKGDGEKNCKATAQQFFNSYKSAVNGKSEVAGHALSDVCDGVQFACKDGKLRKAYLIRALNLVGDADWFFQQ